MPRGRSPLTGCRRTSPGILAVAAEKRTDNKRPNCLAYYRNLDPELKQRARPWPRRRSHWPPIPSCCSFATRFPKPVARCPRMPGSPRLRRDVELSAKQLEKARLTFAQDLAWALINSPAFLFNH